MMAIYFTGFKTNSLSSEDSNHMVVSPEKLNWLSSTQTEESSAGQHVIYHDCVMTWASMLVICAHGSLYVSNNTSPGWKYIETDDEVQSAAVKWTVFWLLLKNGKLHTVKESTDQSHSHISQAYEVKRKGDNPSCISLSYLTAGESFLLGCSDEGECGELELSSDECDELELSSDEDHRYLTWSPLSLPASIQQVSCGKEHAVLLTEAGQIFTYGLGSRGQLGHNSTENCNTPNLVEQLDGLRVVNVTAGGWHSMAVTDIGDLYVWGWNESGQLGLPSKPLRDKMDCPKDISANDEPVVLVSEPFVVDFPTALIVVDISCGSRHSAIVTDTGNLLTTGWNDYGQLGLGDTVSRDSFTTVTSLRERHLVAERVECGYWRTVIWTSEDATQAAEKT